MTIRNRATKSSRYLQFTTVISIIAFSVSGCATMRSSKEELQALGENEGIVIGSILIKAEKTGEDKKLLGLSILGAKSAEHEYELVFKEKTLNPIDIGIGDYRLTVKPDNEHFFVKKLSAGTYLLEKIERGNVYWQIKELAPLL